jgi:hypothetical protein
MDITALAQNIENKEDFVNFLQQLHGSLINNPEEWENPKLERYLEAMESFLRDSTENSLNKIDFTPSWSLFAKILIAASIYE